MINFILRQENLNDRVLSDNLNIVEETNERIIENCIEFFNSEIKWDGMFDLNEAKSRINKGDKFFVGYQNGIIFGYCWLTKLDINHHKIYNVFSRSTKQPRTYGATDMLYYVIKNYTKGDVIAEVDEWNTKSINVFMKLGFNQFE